MLDSFQRFFHSGHSGAVVFGLKVISRSLKVISRSFLVIFNAFSAHFYYICPPFLLLPKMFFLTRHGAGFTGKNRFLVKGTIVSFARKRLVGVLASDVGFLGKSERTLRASLDLSGFHI